MSWRTILRHRWRAFTNWRQGYAWSYVQRCRTCRHTTPFHYAWCDPTRDPRQP